MTLSLILWLYSALATAQELTPAQQAFVTKADAEIAKLQKTFMAELQGAMKGGAPKAMQHCHLKAPHLTQAQQGGEITYGRTSHKLRSPGNKPEEWMQPHLEAYRLHRAESGKDKGFFVAISENDWGYLKPIYVKSQCLVCHGETLSVPVKSKLKERYLDDKATNFKVGDFRGFFWAKTNSKATTAP